MLFKYFQFRSLFGKIKQIILNNKNIIKKVDKLVKGEIEVNMEALSRVKSYVNRLRAIDSVIVHSYSNPTREKVQILNSKQK